MDATNSRADIIKIITGNVIKAALLPWLGVLTNVFTLLLINVGLYPI